MPIRVLLADDSDLVRRAIRRLLTDQPGISLVGEATDFAQAVQLSKDLQPNVLILDLHMSDGNKIGSAEFKSELDRDATRVIAISAWNDEQTQALAQSYGAVKLLDKVDMASLLIPAIREIAPPHSRRE
jgi:DNA-binding NarL/FixJ family response regulator